VENAIIMTTKIVGLGYKARQGKTFVADAMKAAGGDRVKLYAFAEELKTFCRDHHDELFATYPDVPKTQKDDPIYGYTAMLQHYGTNVVRAANPNHWVETLTKRIEAEKPEIAVITDVRFPNEAQFVKDNDGVLIRIQRILADGTQYLDPNRDPKHPSEVALDGYGEWDFMVDCQDGAVEQLKAVGQILMKAIADSENIFDIPVGDSMPDASSVPGPDGDSTTDPQ
jgi:hypothetical protein